MITRTKSTIHTCVLTKVSKLPVLHRRRRPSTAITEIGRQESSTRSKAKHSCLYNKVWIFHWTFFVIRPILDDPERRCCEQTVRTYRLEKDSRKVSHATHWQKTSTDYTQSPWCSGYHVCLTRTSSAVQACAVTKLLFYWVLHGTFHHHGKKKQTEWFRCSSWSKTKQLNRSKKLASMKPSCNQACLDYSDTA